MLSPTSYLQPLLTFSLSPTSPTPTPPTHPPVGTIVAANIFGADLRLFKLESLNESLATIAR